MKYVIANWKMNQGLVDVKNWFETYKKEVGKLGTLEKSVPVVAPSFVHIPFAFFSAEDSPEIKIASQDISHYGKGSHTGESGAFQIKEFCKYCIVGHSERKEPKELVLQKRDIALNEGLVPIVCFISPESASDYYSEGCILAWEDPANISGGGSYKEKPFEEIEKVVSNMKENLPKSASLVYGGSVNKDNIGKLAAFSLLDGVLVGQASLDPLHFLELIKAYEI